MILFSIMCVWKFLYYFKRKWNYTGELISTLICWNTFLDVWFILTENSVSWGQDSFKRFLWSKLFLWLYQNVICLCDHICYEDAKLVSRTAGILAWNMTVALQYSNSHHVLYFHALAVKKKKSILFRNVLDKTVKITRFITQKWLILSTLF